jgi:hypothetical protein
VFTEHPVRCATVADAECFGRHWFVPAGLRKGAVCKTVGYSAKDKRGYAPLPNLAVIKSRQRRRP